MKSLALTLTLALAVSSCSSAESQTPLAPSFTTSTFEGVWTTYPRRPYANMDIFVDGSYLLRISNPAPQGNYTILTCKDTLVAITPPFFYEGTVNSNGSFTAFWSDTTKAVKISTLVQGTCTDTLITMKLIIASPSPCNARTEDIFYLLRVR